MVSLIFGIIFLIIGVITGIALYSKKIEHYQEDEYGRYVRDSNGNRITVEERPFKKWALIPPVAGLILAIIMVAVSCIASVPTGHTGVLTTFGKVENTTFDAGFNIKAPWQKVVKMDNRVQKANTVLSCFSSDIQEVTVSYTLNYQIDKANAQEIYKTVGTAYYDTVIVPNVAEAVKLVTAKYTAEQLVGSRAELATSIEDVLKSSLERYNIQVVSAAIEDMDFTDAFTNAVEAKQVAAQNKLKAETEQEQANMEAEKAAERAKIKAQAAADAAKIAAEADAEVAKTKANAEAEVTKIAADAEEYKKQKEAAANQAVAESLTEELLKYFYINGWDGKLPDTYVGSDDVSTIINGVYPNS